MQLLSPLLGSLEMEGATRDRRAISCIHNATTGNITLIMRKVDIQCWAQSTWGRAFTQANMSNADPMEAVLMTLTALACCWFYRVQESAASIPFTTEDAILAQCMKISVTLPESFRLQILDLPCNLVVTLRLPCLLHPTRSDHSTTFCGTLGNVVPQGTLTAFDMGYTNCLHLFHCFASTLSVTFFGKQLKEH